MKKLLSSAMLVSVLMTSIAFASDEVKVGNLKIENPTSKSHCACSENERWFFED